MLKGSKYFNFIHFSWDSRLKTAKFIPIIFFGKPFILLDLVSLAQGKLTNEGDKNLKTLIDNTLNTTILWDRSAEMIDTYGYHLVGSEGLEKSIDWIVKLIKKYGIKVYTEPVKVKFWRREHESLKLLTKSREEVNMKADTLDNSVSTPRGGITAKAIPVSGWHELNQLLAKDPNAVSGKIVLYNFPAYVYAISRNDKALYKMT